MTKRFLYCCSTDDEEAMKKLKRKLIDAGNFFFKFPYRVIDLIFLSSGLASHFKVAMHPKIFQAEANFECIFEKEKNLKTIQSSKNLELKILWQNRTGNHKTVKD